MTTQHLEITWSRLEQEVLGGRLEGPLNERGHRTLSDPATTDAAVAFLSRPEAYPERPRAVDVIETHLSWVFLTDTRAYKLKKAATHDGLDLRTLESRRWNGQEEVRLNRRLAPDVYLGTTPLMRGPTGGLHVGEGGGEGEPVDWLVVMRRLPADCMLDRQIAAGRVDEGQVRLLAHRLARFYASAPRAARTGPEHRRLLEEGVRGDRRELSDRSYGLDLTKVARVADALLGTLARSPGRFDERAAAGHLVEGHGDLRPEHICLGPEPVVIDCLEFSRELRLVDPADELAFLALECERLGAPHVGRWVIDEYERCSGDRPPPDLLRFYRGYRACRRATLAVWHLRDRRPDGARWRARAERYLDLALGDA